MWLDWPMTASVRREFMGMPWGNVKEVRLPHLPNPRGYAMAITITTPTILAVDLGKFNSVFCWYELANKATEFRTVATTPEKLREVLLRRPNVTVVIEACSPAGWVSDLCSELGLPVIVANTNGDAWAWKNVKRKTDRDEGIFGMANDWNFVCLHNLSQAVALLAEIVERTVMLRQQA
jgi:hypothetical protein